MKLNPTTFIKTIFLSVFILACAGSAVSAQANPDAVLKEAFAQLNAGTIEKDAAKTAAGLDLLRKFAQEAPDKHKLKKQVVATLAWLDKMRETERQLAPDAEALASDPHRTNGTPSISGGRLLKFIRPDYPQLASEANAHDKIPVQFEIGEDGKVIRVFSVSGHPLLQQAAAEAALKHQFAPLVINGAPVKRVATLTFTF